MTTAPMSLAPQAAALNETLGKNNPALLEMLSSRGKAIYFPKLGILSQSAEAKGKDINATIGIATEDDGGPLFLDCIGKNIKLPPDKAFTYAPSPGLPEIRKLWKEQQLRKNPGLAGKTYSSPVVTSALTHGLSMAAYLFVEAGDTVILPDLYWENYDLAFSITYGARLDPFETFTPAGAFNVEGLRQKLSQGRGKKIVLLNFPNNPSGYTPLEPEAAAIAQVLREAAEAGDKVVVILDDAYFGLVFEKGVATQSLFVPLCDAHPNLMAVKLDGPTKEDYVWGFRVGFMAFGIKGGSAEAYAALEAKAAGAVRGTISNSSILGQSLLVQAWSAESYEREKQAKHATLKQRYEKIKAILAAHPEYREVFDPVPFNSGYFMCIRLRKGNAEAVRQKLLKEYSTGVIAFGPLVRLAFSSTPTARLEALFDNVYRAARSCG
jgi:aspartate/methionine/tyrosine aminotransferase